MQVNGVVVSELGSLIDPTQDRVTIHGERILPPDRTTIMLNKPTGYLTSTEDTHDRLTVMDLLPRKLVEAGVLPAGRLDYETEGLLILTNDGDLQHRITHPRFGCLKEYRAHLSRPLRENDQRRLERGVNVRELAKRTAPAIITLHQSQPDGSALCHITIGEGMKRQVRRMFQVVGIDVLHLERVAIGSLTLGKLARGQWRTLSMDEVHALSGPAAAPSTPPAPVRGRRKRAPPRSRSRS